MRINIDELRRAAAGRGEGYMEDVMSSGHLDGNDLVLTDEQWVRLANKYRPRSTMVVGPADASKPPVLLGDVLARWLAPVKWLLLKVGVKECGCARRQEWVNRQHARFTAFFKRWRPYS